VQPTPMTGTAASNSMATRNANSRTSLIRDALSIDSGERNFETLVSAPVN
jgi:hypothetical protein